MMDTQNKKAAPSAGTLETVKTNNHTQDTTIEEKSKEVFYLENVLSEIGVYLERAEAVLTEVIQEYFEYRILDDNDPLIVFAHYLPHYRTLSHVVSDYLFKIRQTLQQVEE